MGAYFLLENITSSVLSALKCIFHCHDHKRKRSRSLFSSSLLLSLRTTEKSEVSSAKKFYSTTDIVNNIIQIN